MLEANYRVGDTFSVQFAWKLPDGDFLRAVFEAEVLYLDFVSDKYVIRLNALLAGRQESEDGVIRQVEELSKEYWALVGRIVGKKVSLAFEAGDGRPLWLRLATLTGEHNFFTRLNEPVKSSRPV